MEVPPAFQRLARPGALLVVRRELREPAGGWASWLEQGPARLRAAASGVAGGGRGAARRLELGGRQAVWRHNRHGGLLAVLQGDRYAGPGRLLRELALSEVLRGEGIPTPAVLLALAWRRGPWWRQELVTEEVPGAVTVFAARQDARALATARALLEALFTAGLWMPDLHPGNLLWQPATGRCLVIDLAGARLLGRPLAPRERAARLQRFCRYFRKHAGRVPPGFLAPAEGPAPG